jgi:NAD(P)H-hydrate epimerase
VNHESKVPLKRLPNYMPRMVIKDDQVEYPENSALELNDFKAMDYFAVNHYHLPIELLMENAGLHLASFIARFAQKSQAIKIGIGKGNNGGGGLVAARRLLAWGYAVYLDLITDISKDLPQKQLKRALSFGAQTSSSASYDVWVDAYFGFSQRLPLPDTLLKRIEKANESDALRISLDIPTGFDGNPHAPYFHCDKVLTMAAPKKLLYRLPDETEIFIADLGIPAEVYRKFDIEPLAFHTNNILRLIR